MPHLIPGGLGLVLVRIGGLYEPYPHVPCIDVRIPSCIVTAGGVQRVGWDRRTLFPELVREAGPVSDDLMALLPP